MKGVFTVIVTYNATPWIKKCLHSLLKSTIQPEIIVIDNASTDDTLAYLHQSSAYIHLIQNEVNKGFGQANNQGILYALQQGARFIFLMNQDVYVFPNTIELLCKSLEAHPQFGIISALQLQADGQQTDGKMQTYIKKNYRGGSINEIRSKEGRNSLMPLKLRFINAAAWMLSRECILTTGLFHTAFYHYGEDNHYCSRVQYHGFKTGFLPAAKVIHDRKQENENEIAALRKKLKTVPLYTLLDIRKAAPLALILGRQKLNSAWQKLKKAGDTGAKEIYEEQKLWFTKNLSASLNIRKQTKKKWNRKEIQ